MLSAPAAPGSCFHTYSISRLMDPDGKFSLVSFSIEQFYGTKHLWVRQIDLKIQGGAGVGMKEGFTPQQGKQLHVEH